MSSWMSILLLCVAATLSQYVLGEMTTSNQWYELSLWSKLLWTFGTLFAVAWSFRE